MAARTHSAGRVPKALLCLYSAASLPFFVFSQTDHPPLTRTGPQACPGDGSESGYVSTTALTTDMLLDHDGIVTALLSSGNAAPTYEDMIKYIKGKEDQYVYILCPNTVFDLGDVNPATKPGETSDEQTDLPIVPFVSSSIIQCGKTGSSDNNCTVTGGLYHVLFEDDHLVTNTTLAGITFEDNRLISVAAYGHQLNDGYFFDCVWQNNALTPILIDLAYDPDLQFGIIEPGNFQSRRRLGSEEISMTTPVSKLAPMFRDRISADYETYSKIKNRASSSSSPSLPAPSVGSRRLQDDVPDVYPGMLAGFIACAFKRNSFGFGLLNEGGRLDMFATTVTSNTGITVVVVLSSGQLALRGGTTFSDNVDVYGPVFLASSSFLVENKDVVGGGNVAVNLDGEQVDDGCSAIFKENSEGSDCLSGKGMCSGQCCTFGLGDCFAAGGGSGKEEGGGVEGVEGGSTENNTTSGGDGDGDGGSGEPAGPAGIKNSGGVSMSGTCSILCIVVATIGATLTQTLV